MRKEEIFARTRDFASRPGTLAGPRDLGPLGALPGPEGVLFRVWAPRARSVGLRVEGPAPPNDYSMEAEGEGYYRLFLEGALPGTRYRYLIDEKTLRPDPASRLQQEGVHGPSTVWGASEAPPPRFPGHALSDLVFYELHVGTFSPPGTFEGILPALDHLTALGVTALELMPIAQFPGRRNWGYDGVYPFAVQDSYGGPDGLLRLVREAHIRGLSVFLDVVYNHLGPEGNYLSSFGPYFSSTTRTPWGEALNFDGPDSDHVRHFFIEHLRTFALVFDIDGFRFDALHAIRDQSPHPFLADLSLAAENIGSRRGRPLHLVAESNANDRRTVIPVHREGLGLDAQWSDDFHHALHVILTRERNGYYEDFHGMTDLLEAFGKGFVYRGQPSRSFRCRRGSPSEDLPGASFVFFAQNHDQTGNRMQGERLSSLAPPEALPAILALVLLSPGLPLLFMGEEYGETRPFLYFTDHGDPDLIEAVRAGRKNEFGAFSWTGEIPDPGDPLSFERSRLILTDPSKDLSSSQRSLIRWTARLSHIRKSLPALAPPPRISGPDNLVLSPGDRVFANLRRDAASESRTLLLVNLSGEGRRVSAAFIKEVCGLSAPRPLLDSLSMDGDLSPDPLPDPPDLLLSPFRALLLSEASP